MNRFTRYGLYAFLSVLMAVLIVVGQRVVMMPGVYFPIEKLGERVGMVLPSGHVAATWLIPDQPSLGVVLDPPAGLVLEVPDALGQIYPQLSSESTNSALAGMDMRIPATVVVLYLAALFLVSTISLWKRSREDFRTIRPWPFVGILSLGSGICVIFATFFWVARVFWTGANEVFSARSAIPIPGSSTVKVQGDQLLAMGTGGWVMLLMAMVLTVLPILVWIDLKLFRRISTGDHHDSASKHVLLVRLDKIFSERAVRYSCAMCYGVVVLFLWTAPWSTAMVGVLWA